MEVLIYLVVITWMASVMVRIVIRNESVVRRHRKGMRK